MLPDGLQSDIRLLQGNHNVAPVTASVPQSSMIRDHQMISRLWSRLAPTWWFTFFGESESERFEKPPIGTAPSRSIIVGRYVLQPDIMDVLARQPSGVVPSQ